LNPLSEKTSPLQTTEFLRLQFFHFEDISMVRRAAPKKSTETSIPALEKELAQLELKIEKARSKALVDAKKQSDKLAGQLSKLRAKAKAERGKVVQAKAALRLKKTPAKQNRLIKITDNLKLINEQISEVKDLLATQQSEFKALKADIKNTKIIASAVAKVEKTLGIKRNSDTVSVTKTPAKKAPAKKKAAAKKAPSKKTPVKKAVAKKAPAKKKATTSKKAVAKKAVVKKAVTKKTPAKKSAAAKKTTVKKAVPKAKKTAQKMPLNKNDGAIETKEALNTALIEDAVVATEVENQTETLNQGDAQTSAPAPENSDSLAATNSESAAENTETAPSLFK
jgi:hypothetical protein